MYLEGAVISYINEFVMLLLFLRLSSDTSNLNFEGSSRASLVKDYNNICECED